MTVFSPYSSLYCLSTSRLRSGYLLLTSSSVNPIISGIVMVSSFVLLGSGISIFCVPLLTVILTTVLLRIVLPAGIFWSMTVFSPYSSLYCLSTSRLRSGYLLPTSSSVIPIIFGMVISSSKSFALPDITYVVHPLTKTAVMTAAVPMATILFSILFILAFLP